MILNREGKVLACNAAGAACFGRNGGVLVGKNFKELDLPVRHRALLEAFELAVGSGEAQQVLPLTDDRASSRKSRIGTVQTRDTAWDVIIAAESHPVGSERPQK